jgi:hypothetical protein
VVIIVEEAGAIAGAAEEVALARADDEDATADEEDARAEEAELKAELADDVAPLTGVVVVDEPRLKIAISAMMTITATMMMIQVLRFMGKALCWRESTGEVSSSA